MQDMAPSEDDPYSTIFASLKHPTRRLILRNLSQGASRRFSQLQADLDIDSPSLSYHLDALRGLVAKKEETYSLTELGVASLNLMKRVEEPATQTSHRIGVARLTTAWIMVLLLLAFGTYGLIFTTTFDNPAQRWLYSTMPYNLQPADSTSFVIEIKYDVEVGSTFQNGIFIGAIQRPTSTPWSDAVNYASFSVYFQNGTVKYWLTNPSGQLAPDRGRSHCNPPCDQYSPETGTIPNGAGGVGNTFYTEMVSEGEYSLWMENTGQGVATGSVTLGPSRVVYLKPFFFVGIVFLAPALAFVGVSIYFASIPRAKAWRRRRRIGPC